MSFKVIGGGIEVGVENHAQQIAEAGKLQHLGPGAVEDVEHSLLKIQVGVLGRGQAVVKEKIQLVFQGPETKDKTLFFF